MIWPLLLHEWIKTLANVMILFPSPHLIHSNFSGKIRDLGDFKGSEIELLESLTRKSLRFFGETKQEKTALGARPSRGSANDPGFDAFGR